MACHLVLSRGGGGTPPPYVFVVNRGRGSCIWSEAGPLRGWSAAGGGVGAWRIIWFYREAVGARPHPTYLLHFIAHFGAQFDAQFNM